MVNEAVNSIEDAIQYLDAAELTSLRVDAGELLCRILKSQENPDMPDPIKPEDFSIVCTGHLLAHVMKDGVIRVKNHTNGDYTDIETTPAGKKTYISTGSTT